MSAEKRELQQKDQDTQEEVGPESTSDVSQLDAVHSISHNTGESLRRRDSFVVRTLNSAKELSPETAASNNDQASNDSTVLTAENIETGNSKSPETNDIKTGEKVEDTEKLKIEINQVSELNTEQDQVQAIFNDANRDVNNTLEEILSRKASISSDQSDLQTFQPTNESKLARETFHIDQTSKSESLNDIQTQKKEKTPNKEDIPADQHLPNKTELPPGVSVVHSNSSTKDINAELDENNNELLRPNSLIKSKLSEQFRPDLDRYLASSNSGGSLLLPDYAPPSTPYQAKPSNATNLPNKSFTLKKIFGYNGDVMGNNLRVLPSGELLYFVGCFMVLWDPNLNRQRHYAEHDEDICCMDVQYDIGVVASGQKTNLNNNIHSKCVVKVWKYSNLKTQFTSEQIEEGANLISVTFSNQGFLLIVCTLNDELYLYIWDWQNHQMLCKANKLLKNEEIFGALFHPKSDDIAVSYGKKHLNIWKRKENSLQMQKSFKSSLRTGTSLNCLSFLSGGNMITGDSAGVISIWAPIENEGDLDFIINDFHAHDSAISTVLVYPNNYIVSGDISGVLKTWSIVGTHFNLINVAMLPAFSGAISSLTYAYADVLQSADHFLENADDEKMYRINIGTSFNMIFTGSALRATQYVALYEGHIIGIRAIAADPIDKYFYTAALDQKVCKWSKNLLLWCIKSKYQCVSIAVHPSGETLATGCTNGVICVLNTVSGEFITQLSISSAVIGCLNYSPDASLLAAGTQNGILHILPVYDNGNSYDRVTILKCNMPILTLQWSVDARFILTSVNENNYQELILWDLPTTRYLKGVSIVAEDILWHEITCASGDDVRAIWDNENLVDVINLCCHSSPSGEYLVAGDENGFVRLFLYPCLDAKSGFFYAKQGSTAVTEGRFLAENSFFVTCNFEGALFLWELVN